jgi:kumamolisin
MEVTLTLRGPALPDANNLPAQGLSPDEFAKQYSASEEDAKTVARVLQGYGLKIEEVSLPTRSIRVSGTVGQMQAAFQSNLAIYHNAKQGEFRGREGDIQIPAELEGIVTAVLGLDQRQVARRGVGGGPGSPQPLTPADLEQRYNFPAGDAQGQQIAIAEFGGGFFPSDVQAFCQRHNRPVPTMKAVAVNRPAFTLQQIMQLPKPQRREELGASVEVMMDVEIIAALCPASHISVYFATFDQNGWVSLLNQVILERPVALSISWGLAEDDPDWSQAARDAINERLAAAATLGITVCVSSGDDGSGDQLDDGRAHVDFPASSPFVLGVGGTMLTGSAANPREVTWREPPGRRTQFGGGSTGGGVSIFFPRPEWQRVHVTSLNGGSIDGRVVPDIAALAGEPLYDLTFLGQTMPNGGTSASAPLWAALIARTNAQLPAAKRQRFLTRLLYQPGTNGQPIGQAACRDITEGNNASDPDPGIGYQAGSGFDAVTGWGIPDGQRLLAALS